jgi:hypothetical protein
MFSSDNNLLKYVSTLAYSFKEFENIFLSLDENYIKIKKTIFEKKD